MNKEVLFLKYLDGELSEEEVVQLKKILLDEPELQQLFDEVKSQKHRLADTIKMAYPDIRVDIPEFSKPEVRFKTKPLLQVRWWPYAAVVALMLAFTFVYFFNDHPSVNSTANDMVQDDSSQSSPMQFETLNYYISPNRCWHERQMVGSFSESNFNKEIL